MGRKFAQTSLSPKMKLKMTEDDAIFKKEQIYEARKDRNPEKLGQIRLIKNSWIYQHFKDDSTKKTKIALYVNSIIPINENLEPSEKNETHFIDKVGNHCVVACGLKDKNGKECLELEIFGGSDETRYIPVDFPFFEEVQIEVIKINAKYQAGKQGVDCYNRAMNKLGKKLAEKKWEKLEKNWFEDVKRPKYEMLFVRGSFPCFRLKFTS